MKKYNEWLREGLLNQISGLDNKHPQYKDGYLSCITKTFNLMNLIDKTNEIEIPQFVADWIESYLDEGGTKWDIVSTVTHFEESQLSSVDIPIFKWIKSNNRESFLSAVLNSNYRIEKEQLYYAKIKGHELIDVDAEDDENGVSAENYRNIYFVMQEDGKLIIDMKNNGLKGSVNCMTLKQWEELGIDDSNSDFEEIEK